MDTLNSAILIALLFIAAWYDVRQYCIPNALVLSGTIIGVSLNALLPQDIGGLGILTSLAGLGVGLVVLLPLYLLRAMGAGDIKLMAMIGAFAEPASMLSITLYVMLAGGVLAILVVLSKGKLPKLMNNFKVMLLAGPSAANLSTIDDLPESAGKLPYGVAIAIGTLVYLVTTP
ncbi:prepilin peptidase [Nitrosomonas sp. Is37]|uniref:A24 family peptidase n=1 Tax=Nitrosomonas sp. Is37 TaxID=3080535 RepID=UPI00294B743B|nr:prepilin peptidase [Nitrosomonas sp. Is37]MDV6343366.1 prepilin peptidase [Nitrosomonas sp. Is37]